VLAGSKEEGGGRKWKRSGEKDKKK